MSGQGNDAAERSAHVTRGAAERETVGPCVEVAPGQWRLRALVEAEARIAELEAEVAAARERERWALDALARQIGTTQSLVVSAREFETQAFQAIAEIPALMLGARQEPKP